MHELIIKNYKEQFREENNSNFSKNLTATLEYNGKTYFYTGGKADFGDFMEIRNENNILILDICKIYKKFTNHQSLINKEEISEDFYNELLNSNLFDLKINYDDLYDFDFKKDFANKNLDKAETDILEVIFMSRDENAFVDYVFKHNNNVYYICYDVNFTTNTKTIIIKKYNVDEDSDNKVLCLTFKNNNTIVDEYDENEINIPLLIKLEKEFSLDLNLRSFLSAMRINKYLVKDEIKIAKFCYDGVICTIHSRFINLSESTFVHEVNIIGENKKEIFTYRKKFGTIFDEPIYYFDENVVTEDFMKLLYADNKTKDVLTKYFSLYDVDYETMLERNRNTILKKKS